MAKAINLYVGMNKNGVFGKKSILSANESGPDGSTKPGKYKAKGKSKK